MATILRVEQVIKTYCMGEVSVPALRGIDVALERGDLCVRGRRASTRDKRGTLSASVTYMRIPHALLLLTLAGCGGMMTGPGAVRGAFEDAIEEDQTHLSAARTVTTMPAMFGEVDRHTSRMDAIMRDMRTHMASMRHCSGIDSMMELTDRMHVELDAHAATIHEMAHMDDARTEVEHHVGAMGTMLGDMGTMLDATHCSGW